MGLLQVFFLFVLPALLIVTQAFLLIFSRKHYATIYYKWTIADVIINGCSVWSYIISVQNLTIEHAQNSIMFE